VWVCRSVPYWESWLFNLGGFAPASPTAWATGYGVYDKNHIRLNILYLPWPRLSIVCHLLIVWAFFLPRFFGQERI
jgi:hypothetical protein